MPRHDSDGLPAPFPMNEPRPDLPLASVLTESAFRWAPAVTAVVPALRPLFHVRDRVPGDDSVAVTFDDGPHPEGTPAVLESLAREQVRATFFLVGEWAKRHPSLAAEIVAAGHEVGVHCYHHRLLLGMAPRHTREDLDRAAAAIADATGRDPRLYRPTFGVLTLPALRHARRRGWEPLLWTRDAKDWKESATPASVVLRLTAGLRAGDVMLLHDGDPDGRRTASRKVTADSVPLVCEEIRRLGLRPVPL